MFLKLTMKMMNVVNEKDYYQLNILIWDLWILRARVILYNLNRANGFCADKPIIVADFL